MTRIKRTQTNSQQSKNLTDCVNNISKSRTKGDSHSRKYNECDINKNSIEINIKNSIVLVSSDDVDALFNGNLINLVTKNRLKEKQSGSDTQYGRKIAKILKNFFSLW